MKIIKKESIMNLKELGVLDYKSVGISSHEKSTPKVIASYYKIKQGFNTSPRLNTRLMQMPEGVLF